MMGLDEYLFYSSCLRLTKKLWSFTILDTFQELLQILLLLFHSFFPLLEFPLDRRHRHYLIFSSIALKLCDRYYKLNEPFCSCKLLTKETGKCMLIFSNFLEVGGILPMSWREPGKAFDFLVKRRRYEAIVLPLQSPSCLQMKVLSGAWYPFSAIEE